MEMNAATARSRGYKALSVLFRHPADAALLAEAVRGLRDAIGTVADEGTIPFPLPVPREVVSAFRAVFDHTLTAECPPYETQYGAAHLFMQTQELADIAGFYRAWGVDLAEGGERVDHLSVELEFMAYLALKERRAIERGEAELREFCREAQRKFLAEHLGQWVPAFAMRLSARGGDGFYGALARTLEAFVKRELESLGATPADLGPIDLLPVGDDPDDDCSRCGVAGSCPVGSPQMEGPRMEGMER